MNVKVKICGIRSIEAAKTAADAGADFLGFNFVPTSARYIDPQPAAKTIHSFKRQVKIVGVFQDAEINYVNNLILTLGLDFVQLHGHENNEYINQLGIPVIKSIAIDGRPGSIKADYLLLDRVKRGEGKMINFQKAAKLAANYPVFYAGGLNPDNVAAVIQKVKPFAVDVAGGIETNGREDLEKIKLFLKNAKGASI
ncbi:MAG: phosphoribosylanthranilate isomerase [Candidatus Daviesbacteria bacterium]|nr:phosphoribosylanthranilate isomerase [Candidatus Daviesbacteria bacterium]